MKQQDPIKQVLNSLEGLEKAKAPGDGFARIQQRLAGQRLAGQQKPAMVVGRKSQWIRVAAAVTFVIIVNIWAVSNFVNSNSRMAQNSGDFAALTTDLNLYGNEQ